MEKVEHICSCCGKPIIFLSSYINGGANIRFSSGLWEHCSSSDYALCLLRWGDNKAVTRYDPYVIQDTKNLNIPAIYIPMRHMVVYKNG